MQKVHLLFTQMHHNLKTGEKFDEVEFDVEGTMEGMGGLTVYFSDGSRYLYPWHTLKRVRIKSVDTK